MKQNNWWLSGSRRGWWSEQASRPLRTTWSSTAPTLQRIRPLSLHILSSLNESQGSRVKGPIGERRCWGSPSQLVFEPQWPERTRRRDGQPTFTCYYTLRSTLCPGVCERYVHIVQRSYSDRIRPDPDLPVPRQFGTSMAPPDTRSTHTQGWATLLCRASTRISNRAGAHMQLSGAHTPACQKVL